VFIVFHLLDEVLVVISESIAMINLLVWFHIIIGKPRFIFLSYDLKTLLNYV
jgi:hypothetical protein